MSAFYLDLYIELDNGAILKAKLYDKRDDFTFRIVNFPFINRNIPETPAYGVYISQPIRHCKVCAQYSDFLAITQLLTQKLLKQGNIVPRLDQSLKCCRDRNQRL